MSFEFKYDDFYKFLTSLGVGLIALAVLVPWLFLREPFDLLSKQDDINALTPLARQIIEHRQVLVGQVIKVIPWFSVGSLILGFIMLIGGSILWWTRNQRLLDRQQQANLAILLKQLEPATEQQVESKFNEEAKKEAVVEPNEAKSQKIIDDFVPHARMVEKTIASKLQSCFSSNYEVLTNQRLGDIFFDVLLLAKDEFRKDCIVEIKYARQNFNYEIIHDTFLKIAHIKNVYAEETNRSALGFLLIVMPSELMKNVDIQNYQERIRQEGSIFRKAKTYFAILSEEELKDLRCYRLKDIFLFKVF